MNIKNNRAILPRTTTRHSGVFLRLKISSACSIFSLCSVSFCFLRIHVAYSAFCILHSFGSGTSVFRGDSSTNGEDRKLDVPGIGGLWSVFTSAP